MNKIKSYDDFQDMKFEQLRKEWESKKRRKPIRIWAIDFAHYLDRHFKVVSKNNSK